MGGRGGGVEVSTDYISRPDSLTKLIVVRILLWLSSALSNWLPYKKT